VAAVATSGYVLGALFAAMAVLPPTANTTILTQQLLLTPDHLRGRLSSVIGLAGGVAAAVGPVLGGALMHVASGTAAVLLCAAGVAAVTVVVTASPTLRRFPRGRTEDEVSLPV
jgi:MFS family permease